MLSTASTLYFRYQIALFLLLRPIKYLVYHTQGPYFTAVDLATIGHQMDDEERSRMLEAGTTEEYNRFIQVCNTL